MERKMYCWIQVPVEEANILKEEKKVAKQSGYHYMDKLTGNEMVEFHVNTCQTFMGGPDEQGDGVWWQSQCSYASL
jgi:hypothetical protein